MATLKLSIRQQVNRIKKWINQSSPDQISDGLDWYQSAHLFALAQATRFNLEICQVANVISILSPQQSWERNKLNTIQYLTGDPTGIFATKSQLQDCARALYSPNWMIPSSRLKTRAFSECIQNPQSDQVVIDRHAIKVCFDQTSSDPILITDKRYRDAAESFKKVAFSMCLKPCQIQAITWLTYKSIVGR